MTIHYLSLDIVSRALRFCNPHPLTGKLVANWCAISTLKVNQDNKLTIAVVHESQLQLFKGK